jgi:hypothetical protein
LTDGAEAHPRAATDKAANEPIRKRETFIKTVPVYGRTIAKLEGPGWGAVREAFARPQHAIMASTKD